MSDALEALFMQFPADVRMTIIEALQAQVAGLGEYVPAANAADALTRIGYPESRAAAAKIAAGRAAR